MRKGGLEKNDLWIVAAAGLAVYLILRKPKGAVSVGEPVTLWGEVTSAVNQISSKISEVVNGALPGQPGYGWRYFDNGVAISPTGEYYKNGVKVWSPGGGGATGGW